MISQRLGTSGPISEQTEEFQVTYPRSGGGVVSTVLVPTKFNMGAGSMVIVSIDQNDTVFFLVTASHIDASGVVSIDLYNVNGTELDTILTTHICVKAHSPDQYGH